MRDNGYEISKHGYVHCNNCGNDKAKAKVFDQKIKSLKILGIDNLYRLEKTTTIYLCKRCGNFQVDTTLDNIKEIERILGVQLVVQNQQ